MGQTAELGNILYNQSRQFPELPLPLFTWVSQGQVHLRLDIPQMLVQPVALQDGYMEHIHSGQMGTTDIWGTQAQRVAHSTVWVEILQCPGGVQGVLVAVVGVG
jgi:hypothetical protein